MTFALVATMRDGLLRRSEAAALLWSDIEFRDDETGRLTIRHSKTDQEGEGAIQFIAKDTVKALKAHSQATPETRSVSSGSAPGHTVSARIAAAARAAGLEGR